MINKTFMHFETDSAYQLAKQGGEIPYNAIAFCKESQIIYTHNLEYDCLKITKVSELENDSNFITDADIQNKPDIITRIVTSESDGKITIEDIEGYTFLNAIAFNNDVPLVVIRFGDYFYVGYYGGTEVPNADTAVSLMFTGKSGIEVTIYYINI